MNDFHHRLEREIPRLRRYARALTRNAVRADDLVQETLVRALYKGHLWQPGTDLRAWLFTIMHNQNVNEIRRAIRDDATVDLENCSAILTATTDPTASRQLCELDQALAQLPEEQRQVILLVGLEGVSYEDAAAILDVPIGTIRSRLSRGRESLRKLMDMEVKPANSAALRNLGPRRSGDATQPSLPRNTHSQGSTDHSRPAPQTRNGLHPGIRSGTFMLGLGEVIRQSVRNCRSLHHEDQTRKLYEL